MTAQISLKDLPKDIINLLSGIVEENASRKAWENSFVYELVYYTETGVKVYTHYFSRNLQRLRDEMIDTKGEAVDYEVSHINPAEQMEEIYAFYTPHKFITNNKKEAQQFLHRYQIFYDGKFVIGLSNNIEKFAYKFETHYP